MSVGQNGKKTSMAGVETSNEDRKEEASLE